MKPLQQPTQEQMFRAAERRFFDRIHQFVEMQSGPNPLTKEEIARLAERHPQRWGCFAGFGR